MSKAKPHTPVPVNKSPTTRPVTWLNTHTQRLQSLTLKLNEMKSSPSMPVKCSSWSRRTPVRIPHRKSYVFQNTPVWVDSKFRQTTWAALIHICQRSYIILTVTHHLHSPNLVVYLSCKLPLLCHCSSAQTFNPSTSPASSCKPLTWGLRFMSSLLNFCI